MKGKNPINAAKSWLDGRMKGKNPINAAESGLDGEMKGINPIDAGDSDGIRVTRSTASAPDIGRS
ncbi:hypothetical protein MKY64_15225 [Paenibacillus sp. FSL R7-0210]